jgi:hypothetical protein
MLKLLQSLPQRLPRHQQQQPRKKLLKSFKLMKLHASD